MPNDSDLPGSAPMDAIQPGAPSPHASALPRVLADDQMIALHEVANSIAQDRSLQSTLSLITEKARFLTSSASIALCLLDEDRETLDFVAVAGRGASEMLGQRVRVGDALPGQTAVSGESLLAFNPAESESTGKVETSGHSGHARAAFDEQFVRSGGVRSAAVAPIVIDTASVGSLAAINRLDEQSYTGADLLMLQILASSASAAIQKDFLVRRAGQRERERNILFRVAQNTASSLDTQRILDGMLDTLITSADMFAAIIFLLNDERTHLYIAAAYGLSEDEHEIQILADGRIASAAFASGGTAFIIDDVEHDPRFEEILPQERAQVQSMMVVPLAARDVPSGLMIVMSRQSSAYAKDDLALLAAVSAQTATAIENATLYEDATRRAEEATAIYELSQAVNSNRNLQGVLDFVADSILALLQIDKFALFLHNPDKNCLEIKVARNISRDTVQSMKPNSEHRGVAWWVFEYETPTAVQDVAADHRNRSYPIEGEGVASLLSVPLQAGDEVLGVVHAMSSRRRSFNVAEMELLYTIANQIGTAISNIKILEQTRRKSDDLRRNFRKVSRAIAASADPVQTAHAIADLASDLMSCERVVLYSTSSSAGVRQLSILGAHGMRLPASIPGSTAATTSPVQETSAAWIARRGRLLAIDAPGQDPRFAPAALLAPYVSRCAFYLGVPLKIGKEVVGVIEIYGREPRKLSTSEMRPFLTFAAQSAVALQNSLLVEDAARRKRDLEAIAEIGRILHATDRIDARALASCMAQLVVAADAEYALISSARLRQKRKGLLVGREGIVDGVGEGAARDTLRRAIETMRGRQASDAAWPSSGNDVWFAKSDPRPVLVLQFTASDPELGAIGIARTPGRAAFDSADEHLVRTVATLFGIALKRCF